MGKCEGCVFGTIRKSVGPLTFAHRNGEQIVYLKPEREHMVRKSLKITNTNTVNLLISQLYNELFKKHLSRYWDTRKAPKRSYNLFSLVIKGTFSSLYDSIPDKGKPLGPENWVDMKRLKLTYKDNLIEYINVTGSKFSGEKGGGAFEIMWDTMISRDGREDDTAHVVVIYCEPKESEDIQERFDLKTYYKTGVRKDGVLIVETDFYEDTEHLTAYLFFSREEEASSPYFNDRSAVYSESAAVKVKV